MTTLAGMTALVILSVDREREGERIKSELHCIPTLRSESRANSQRVTNRARPILPIRWDSLLGTRFTVRPLVLGRRAISDIYEGDRRGEGHAMPLDFTTRRVARETFCWRVRSLPLLVQIAFRTLNLFHEVGRPFALACARARVRAGKTFASRFPHGLFSFDITHFRTRA